jgi:hypothetical protein
MKTSMAGPLEDAASGFDSGHHLVDEDVNGKSSLGGAAGGSSSGHHLVNEDVDGGPLRVLPVGSIGATT